MCISWSRLEICKATYHMQINVYGFTIHQKMDRWMNRDLDDWQNQQQSKHTENKHTHQSDSSSSNIQHIHQIPPLHLVVLWRCCLDLARWRWDHKLRRGPIECFYLWFSRVCFSWKLWVWMHQAADGRETKQRGSKVWLCGFVGGVCPDGVYSVSIKTEKWEDSHPELKNNDPWRKFVVSARCTAWSCFICDFI